MKKILNRTTGSVMYAAPRVSTLKGRTFKRLNLTNADFMGEDLRKCVFDTCDLDYASFVSADLTGAQFLSCVGGATLFNNAAMRGCMITGRRSRAKYSEYMRGFQYCSFTSADMSKVNLTAARVDHCQFDSATMQGAAVGNTRVRERFFMSSFCGTIGLPKEIMAATPQLPTGEFQGWKRCRGGRIAQLLIPRDALRSAGMDNKVRASHVRTVSIRTAAGKICKTAMSITDNTCEYRVGDITMADGWDSNPWAICTGGIHFFLTRAEAVKYNV